MIGAREVSYEHPFHTRPLTMQNITDEVVMDVAQLQIRVGTLGGDLAYWHRRAEGLPSVPTGTILQLADPAQPDGRAVLVRDDAPGSGRFVVVSDDVALFRGGHIPSEEEQREGHWVAKVGEVDVVVRGQVRVGDVIGPLKDGSGIGVVKTGAGGGEAGEEVGDSVEGHVERRV